MKTAILLLMGCLSGDNMGPGSLRRGVNFGDTATVRSVEYQPLVDLTGAERWDFEMSCRWRRFVASEHFLDQMDKSRNIYFITQGACES